MNEAFNSGQSKEKSFLLSSKQIEVMVNNRELLNNPIETLQRIRADFRAVEQTDVDADMAFLNELPTIFTALNVNKFSFPSALPNDINICLDPEIDESEKSLPFARMVRSVGVTKEGLRNWIVRDFSTGVAELSATERAKYLAEQKRQLDIIESVYSDI